MAERVRDWLWAFPFLAPDGLDHRLTTLIGIATLPEVMGLVDELMKVADRAILSGQAHREGQYLCRERRMRTNRK